MSTHSSLFSILLRTATPRPAPAPDEYEYWCPLCRRKTIWRHIATVCGRRLYRCQDGCGGERFGHE